MAKVKPSPISLLLKDCHSLMRVFKDGNPVSKLQLEIDFEYYHYRRNLDLSAINIRFEKALTLLEKHNVVIENNGTYKVDREQYESFFNFMLV